MNHAWETENTNYQINDNLIGTTIDSTSLLKSLLTGFATDWLIGKAQ